MVRAERNARYPWFDVGTWGTGIFADDVASDVRDDYREYLGDGLSAQDATDRVLAEWSDALSDPESVTIVWLAVAATQVKVGRLEDRVRDRALAIIDNGEDLARWQDDPKLLRERQRVLEKLRDAVTGPQRSPTRIPRPIRSVWPFEPGSIVAFRRDSGRYLALRVVGAFGEHGVRGGRIGILEPLDWTGEGIPDRSTAVKLRPKVAIDWSSTSPAPLGVSVLNQRQLDRWSVVVSGSGGARFVRHYLINTKELDRVATSRYGL